MLHHFYRYNKLRQYQYQKAQPSPLKDYLACPFPVRDTPINEVTLLALDFETTGLSPRRDKILSIGSVEVAAGAIDLSTIYHQVLRAKPTLTEQNVAIHHITDDERIQGMRESDAIERLLMSMRGKVLLVHYASIERLFLQAVCKARYGLAPYLPIIDTLELAQRRYARESRIYSPEEVRLYALRERYGLPHYKAHDALNDAVSTAELFLADLAHMGAAQRALRDFLSP